jgi:hypothetical protein
MPTPPERLLLTTFVGKSIDLKAASGIALGLGEPLNPVYS